MMSDTNVLGPKGIGGWLILMVIGLALTPPRIGYALYTEHWPLFRDGVWSLINTPGAPGYHALMGPLIIFEIIANLGLMVLALVTLWFLSRKSRHTPKLAISWLLCGATISLIDLFVVSLISTAADKFDPDGIKELGRSLVGVAIWVPYFMVSKRVKATFVE